MSVLIQVSSLALRGAARAAGEMAGAGAAGGAAEAVVGLLTRRFTDQSQRLTAALQRASDRAWRAVEIAVAGNGWWDQCKLALSGASERAFRQQVQAFLQANPLEAAERHGDLRRLALAELRAARAAGLLDHGRLPPDELARRVGDLSRFGDPTAVVEAEFRAVARLADDLRRAGYEYLAKFLELRPGGGPPLLAAAARFFFQRELEHDRELFQGLAYARLESLHEGQSAGFAALADALEQHGDRLAALLGDVHAAVERARADVLDVKAELARQGRQLQELGDAVLGALQQHQLERRELGGGDSLSVRDEGERRLVRELIRRYRALPPEQRHAMPALLNAVGKLEVVTGDFEAAQRDFRELSGLLSDPAARAEAAHNAYRTALERRAWADALTAVREAAALDPARFAPFPLAKYEPERILGAGGFGVAFLCRNRHSGGRVVIKTLRREALCRDLGDVFREAQTLEELEHPAIIRVRDCDYADAARVRPFVVMDYFDGANLAEHVERHGPVRPIDLWPLAKLVAAGLERAHARGILHRDVKPGNLLVRREARAPGAVAEWAVKVIDFGLAMHTAAPGSTRRSSLEKTLAGSSLAGTLDYAAPEQLGRLKGVAVGPYSDVYGFGKTCCFALFGTAQPTYQHWQAIPRELADLLGRCLSEQPGGRPRDFTVVLAELERVYAPKQRASHPPAAAVPRPVLDAVPCTPPRPEPRREPPRAQPRVEELEEVEPAPPPRHRRSSLLVCTVVGLVLGLAGMALTAYLVFVSRGRSVVRPPSYPPPVKPPARGGTVSVGEPARWVPPWGKVDPIAAKEFPALLDELKKKPAPSRRREIVRRLAVTEPTKEQQDRHERRKAVEKAGAAPPKGPTLAQFRAGDDILQVSLALGPLLADPDWNVRDEAAIALAKWGTADHLATLKKLLEDGHEGGVFDFRLHLAWALGPIADDEALRLIALRLADGYDRRAPHVNGGPGFAHVLIGVGPRAEAALWPLLAEFRLEKMPRGTTSWKRPNDADTKLTAIQILERIGTLKSVAELKKITGPPAEEAARAAIAAIERRQKKQ